MTKCSMVVCGNELDPTDLLFKHHGKLVGGLCNDCLGAEMKVRMVLEREKGKEFVPDHITFLPSL